MKDAMPQYNKYTILMQERENKSKQLTDLKEKLSAFGMLSVTQSKPVKIWTYATEPTAAQEPESRNVHHRLHPLQPRPRRGPRLLPGAHRPFREGSRNTSPWGSGLPLFGVVPRMLRNARNHRGGHLWTPGTPDSIEADAYRNLRASLLGATPEKKPIVTLLVTSAKAGEGKSTHRAQPGRHLRQGRRADPAHGRRPPSSQPPRRLRFRIKEGTGLVDVLRGEISPGSGPSCRPTCPTSTSCPPATPGTCRSKVLGSLELRQLLLSLSEHHYDRVILDGPAVLGLADCRMLGRIVDGALMVVRSGSQELRPLQRAKTMLEQSQVHDRGLVFNGLVEDLQNWSSYGPNPMLDPISLDLAGARSAGSRRLEASGTRDLR